MTVLDNVAYGLKQRKVARTSGDSQAAEALELVRLTGRETAKPAELSGGMQQRVALARALVLRPKVLLLDEPLGALDKKLRDAMQIELKRIQRDVGITFIVVTHDQEEAMAMSDRIAVMNDGRIDQLGGPSQIYDHPATPFVADFIGDMNHLEGTLARDGEQARVRRRRGALRDRPRGGGGRGRRRVRIGVRPEELHAGTEREGARRRCRPRWCSATTCRSSPAGGRRRGDGAPAPDRRRGPRRARRPGTRSGCWGPAAALLLGPADGDRPRASATPEPLRTPA